MTAVACLRYKGCPLIVADLLTSGPARPNSQVIFPAVTLQYGQQAVDGPKSLLQKIAIVSDNLVVGWAGKASVASDVIGELKYRCEDERFDNKLLGEYLRRQRSTTWKELEIAGFILHPNNTTFSQFQIQHPSHEFREIPTFGKVSLLGSGNELLEGYLQKDAIIPTCEETPDDTPSRVLTYGMVVAGKFLSMELFDVETFDYQFGGGYEIARGDVNTKTFVKLTDVLYLFWRANVDQKGKLVSLQKFPFWMCRYEYFGDLLVIRCAAPDQTNGTPYAHQNIFQVPPVYRNLTEQEKANPRVPQFNAQWICNFMHVHSGSSSRPRIPTVVGQNTATVECEEQNGRLSKLTIHRALYEHITSIIERPVAG